MHPFVVDHSRFRALTERAFTYPGITRTLVQLSASTYFFQVSPGLVETEIIYATKPHQVELSKQVFAANPHLKPDQVSQIYIGLFGLIKFRMGH